MIFLSFLASLIGDLEGVLAMEFPFNPLLRRSHSLVSDQNGDCRTLEKNGLKTETSKGKPILEGCNALESHSEFIPFCSSPQ